MAEDPSKRGGMLRFYAQPAALALIVVACVQPILVASVGVTQWKGGGFGMFSSVDGGGNRVMRLSVEHGGRVIDVILQKHLISSAHYRRGLYAPTDAALRACAEVVHSDLQLAPYGALYDMASDTSNKQHYEAVLSEQLRSVELGLDASQGQDLAAITDSVGLSHGTFVLRRRRPSDGPRNFLVRRIAILAPTFDAQSGLYSVASLKSLGL